MTKNRTKQAANRAKKAKKRESERLLAQAREAASFKARNAASFAAFQKNPEIGYEFWFHHGLNFLASSYEEGVWDPLFPEIYQGKTVTRTEVFRRLMDRHFHPSDQKLSPSGTRAVLWASLKPKEMFTLVHRGKKLSWAKDIDPCTPAGPEIWNFLHEAMSYLVVHLEEREKTTEGRLQIGSTPYAKILPEIVAHTVANLSGVPDPSERVKAG